MRNQAALKRSPEPIDEVPPTPSELYAALIARGIGDKPRMFLAKKGVVQILVEGDHSLTLRFGNVQQPLELDATDVAADFTMACSRSVMDALLTGTLDGERAFADGSIRVLGNLDLFSDLIQLTQMGRSMLSVRTSF